MNEREEPRPREIAPPPAEEESAFVKELETKEDGRYIIFYSFEDEPEEGRN